MAMIYEAIGEMSFDGITVSVGDNVKCDDGDIEGEVLEIVRIDEETHLLIGGMLVDAYSVYWVNGVDFRDPSDEQEYGHTGVPVPISGGTGVE